MELVEEVSEKFVPENVLTNVSALCPQLSPASCDTEVDRHSHSI